VRHASFRLLPLVLLGALPVAGLRAQVCAGFPSLRGTRYRVAASAANYTYATALRASFTTGKTVFGTLGAGWTRDAELDASAFSISLQAGADIADRSGRVFLCPVADVSVSLGPYNFALERYDYRYVDRSIGLGLAAVAVRSPRFSLLLTGALRAARVTVTAWPTGWQRASGSVAWTQGDDYWLASFGAGFVFGEKVTIRPEVTVPFGLAPPDAPNSFAVPFGRENREVSLGISVGINFGARTRP
jgi:hypothetical protein